MPNDWEVQQRQEMYKGFCKFKPELKKAVDKLTEAQKVMIYIYFVKYSKPEVEKLSKKLGIKPSCVYRRFNRALERLKKIIKKIPQNSQ